MWINQRKEKGENEYHHNHNNYDYHVMLVNLYAKLQKNDENEIYRYFEQNHRKS